MFVLIAPVTSYLHVEVDPKFDYLFAFIYFAIAILLWKKLPFRNWGRVIFVAFSFLAAVITTGALGFLTMYLPGSKEHNHVMYHICLPTIREHYGIKEGEFMQKEGEPVDKDGHGKWWYQHSECERNVYDGKGPVFSENPPEFKPVK